MKKHPFVVTGIALLTLLVTGMSLPAVSHASLQIDKHDRHAALWRRIYDKLPASWKTDQIVAVQEVPFSELNDQNPDQPDSAGPPDENTDPVGFVDGAYDPPDEEMGAPASIRMLDSLGDREAGFVFAHEYGHFIWEQQLTRSQRRSFSRLWNQQKRADHLVSEYAGESPSEGFAEAVGFFLMKPSVLRNADEKSWQFLLQLAVSN